MAAAVVGGAFLSAFLDVVFDRLSSPQVANLIRGKKLDEKLLQRLKNTLYAVQAVLNDAEQKQIKDPAVKKWLDDLKDAVYVADDLLDEVSTKAATQKEEVSNWLSRYLNLQDREMVHKLEDIADRLESIVKHKDCLGLKEIARENFSWRTPTTSLIEVSNIYGRAQDKEAIIKLLLDDNSDGNISVIPIVGMGGVGKTTLAQLVYNDDDLMQKFDLKAWVCVYEEFDILKVTKTIIEAVTSSPCKMKDLNLIQLDLKEKLTGKTFLIVLDDVWNEDYVDWNILRKPFLHGIKGSKILVTTRSENVVSIVQTLPGYHLNHLSDEDCWSVFANHASLSLESCENSTLEKIGREIVKKCKGLPLAAQTLGGLLRTKRDIKEWNTILNSEFWELSENKSKIIPALRISYHYLPPHLKRCFVYCSLYPKDYEFNKDKLILLWMAEDLLKPGKKGKTLEEVGYEYFNDLASRSFFQYSSTYNRCFVMHDLLHDLAISAAGEFYFRSEELGKTDEISMRTRHLSYSFFSYPLTSNFEAFEGVKSLRTFLPINFKFASFSLENASPIILSKFQCLRVLSFHSFSDLEALPPSIGELIHLRYLDLSKTSIQTLPESLTNLYNLQTLKLHSCRRLTMLPPGMQNLVNLRHLDIDGTRLKEMPGGMSKLKDLQHLSKFVVGKHEENGIKELGELSNLHGSLEIEKLENVAINGEALEARIADKKHINILRLGWSRDSDMITSSATERDILDKLQPHKGLNGLTIRGYRGTRFPDWVGHSSYRNMTDLSLYDCHNCCMLPSLGQLPSLKSLHIYNLSALETIGAEFYKNDEDRSSPAALFPSLEYLAFWDMPCLQTWWSFESSHAFPQLKFLSIRHCPRLRGDLPNQLPALETLHIHSCNQLASSLPRAPKIRELEIDDSNKVRLQELPLSLHRLVIKGCQLVESMFQAITITQPTCQLQTLDVSGCSCAISFPGGCLPASLKTLRIDSCRDLEFPKQQQHELLESLSISKSCDSLTSFPGETFPNLKELSVRNCENMVSFAASQYAALQSLYIHGCPNFVSFPSEESFPGETFPNLKWLFVMNCENMVSFPVSQYAALQSLQIHGCPNFVSFPSEGLVAPSMTSFDILACDNLKSLPSQMNKLIPKLESLSIKDCPEIDSFPAEGLPPNMKTLSIENCNKLLSNLASMGIHEGLTHLKIYKVCESGKSFPKEGLLPQLPCLTSLELRKISSMETLDCRGLLHLTSLQKLQITKCPKLENMAGDRLPASLILLNISTSPLLEERCKMKHPQIWPKISHIRGIQVEEGWIS